MQPPHNDLSIVHLHSNPIYWLRGSFPRVFRCLYDWYFQKSGKTNLMHCELMIGKKEVQKKKLIFPKPTVLERVSSDGPDDISRDREIFPYYLDRYREYLPHSSCNLKSLSTANKPNTRKKFMAGRNNK